MGSVLMYMLVISTHWWRELEQWQGTAFLIGGAIFLVDTVLLIVHMSSGTEPAAFGQALVGASWTAAFIGLLGFYPSLANQTRWLARTGAVFAVIGGITMAAMSGTMLGHATGVLNGGSSDVAMYFLPGVFLGVVFGFGSFGLASLRSGIFARSVSLLLLLLPLTFLFNIGSAMAGFNPLAKILGVVTVLTLTMLIIGYLLRTGAAVVDREGVAAASDVSTG